MSVSRIGSIATVLLSASAAYAVSNFSTPTTTSLSASTSLLSFGSAVLPASSDLSGSLSSVSSTSGSPIPSSSLPPSSTTDVPSPSSSSSLASGVYLSGETLTETITWLLTVSKTVTYDNDWDTPTLTITGPFTSTETKTVTTQLIATYQNNATASALPPWDRDPYIDYLLYPYPSVNASFAAVLSSFISYGRQPECTAAYSAYVATAPVSTETDPIAIITTTLPGNQVTEFIAYETLTQAPYAEDAYCCWYCSLFYSNVQVFYWPATDANTACLNSVASSTAIITNGNNTARNRDPGPTQPGIEAYATGPDGFVYTSPSIYVAFPTVSGVDECGLVGPPITGLTLAFAPGELSTITNQNPGPVPGSTVAFNPADLPCGPVNGTNGFLPNPANVSSYLPIIALPSKLLAYRPEWASLNCVNDIWEGQDPPYALSPQSQVMPASTLALSVTQNSPIPETTPAVPASTFASPASSTAVMQLTTASQLLPAQSSSSSSLVYIPPSTLLVPSIISSADPAAGSPNNDPGVSSTYSIIQSPGTPPVVVGGQSISFTAATPLASPTAVQSQQSPSPIVAGGFTFTPAPVVTSDPVAPTQPVSASAVSIDGQGFTPVPGSSGAIIFNGQTLTQGQDATTINNIPVVLSSGSIFVDGQGTAIPTAPAANPFGLNSPAPPVIAGKTVSVVNPSTIVWGTQTLTLGQPIATISGLPLALGSAGLIIGGSTTIPLASLAPQAAITSAASSPGALQVDGTTLIPGGPAVTVSGTRLSLGLSSNLVVGTSTIYLSTPTSYIVVASETIDLASSDVVVDGKTLTPGSPAVTVNGVLVSLGSSVLVVGSTTKTYVTAGSATTSTAGGIGAAIISAFGGVGVGTLSPSAPTSTGNGTGVYGINPFKGTAVRVRRDSYSWIGGLAILSSMLLGLGIGV
ncbi:Muc22p [Xylographa bjoerkii]|nr:Muc22p [Xylographa bjoerkii]